jgi:predicted ATPase
MLRLAQQTQDPIHQQEALRLIGGALFHQGQFKAAYRYFDRALALYKPQQHTSYTFDYEHDPGIGTLNRLTLTLWMLGYPDQAQARRDEALTLARTVARPFDTFLTFEWAFILAHFQRQLPAAQTWVEGMTALTAQYALAHYVSAEIIYRGWLCAEQGDSEAGIGLLKQGLEILHKRGKATFVPHKLALLAEAYARANQVAKGLTVVAEALVLAEATDEQFWSAELYRLKGELLLAQASAAEESEGCFQQALALARRQEAKLLELRAAMSLARLWQQQGKRGPAHDLLAGIYAWFTEGFATLDLQEAQALVEELA